MNSCLLRALELFEGARRVLVLTGAGMSAESGVPTFRAAQTGLWAQYDPQELATPGAFRRNPSRFLAGMRAG
jgi:NAD-dependent deacetylase